MDYPRADWITALDLEESCKIEQMSLAATSWVPFWPNNHSAPYFQCNDFFDAVVSGFMLSWFQFTCDHFTDDNYCYINDSANNSVQCYPTTIYIIPGA